MAQKLHEGMLPQDVVDIVDQSVAAGPSYYDLIGNQPVQQLNSQTLPPNVQRLLTPPVQPPQVQRLRAPIASSAPVISTVVAPKQPESPKVVSQSGPTTSSDNSQSQQVVQKPASAPIPKDLAAAGVHEDDLRRAGAYLQGQTHQYVPLAERERLLKQEILDPQARIRRLADPFGSNLPPSIGPAPLRPPIGRG